MHTGERSTRVSYASTEHSTACTTTTQPKITTLTHTHTHLLAAAPDTTADIVICKKFTWRTGHAREQGLNQTLHGCTATQFKIPTLIHTYILQHRTRRPTSLYVKSTHAHGERGTRVSNASTKHTAACIGTQLKIPTLTHTYKLQRRTRRPASLYMPKAHTHALFVGW